MMRYWMGSGGGGAAGSAAGGSGGVSGWSTTSGTRSSTPPKRFTSFAHKWWMSAGYDVGVLDALLVELLSVLPPWLRW